MPDYRHYATTVTADTALYGPTDPGWGTGDNTTLHWNLDNNVTNGSMYYRWSGVTGENYPVSHRKVPAEVQRKKFLAETPELVLYKQPELKLVSPDESLDKLPAHSLEYDRIKPIARNQNGHIYEVYDVPEKPYDADPEYYQESLDARGLKKTAMGFYIEDVKLKSAFRFKKMIQLKQPPGYMTPRRLTDVQVSPQELVARKLLRRYVGEKEFKRYQRYGYIMMIAHGYVWKVPGERAMVHRVLQYTKDRVIGSYCVHFEDSMIPPSDACVMRMALINSGIDNLKKHSNFNGGEWGNGSFRSKIDQPAKQLTTMEAMTLVKQQYGI